MPKYKSRSLNDYTLKNINLRNNQNYIINKKRENEILLNYLSKRKIFSSPLNLIWKVIYFIWKEIFFDLSWSKNWFFLLWIIQFLIISLLVIPVIIFLYSISYSFLFFFILFLIYFELKIFKIFYNYFNMRILVLWIRKSNTTYKRNYNQKLKCDYLFKIK